MCVPVLVFQSCPTLCDSMDCTCQASPSMGFSRPEYWSGLACPPPGDLPDPGTEPAAPTSSELAGGFSATSATCKAPNWFYKTNIFSVVMYGCESCTKKKAEHLRIDAFELWCWRRLLRVPWTARRSNQLFLKEISP